MMRLFIGNLDYKSSEKDLIRLFEKSGYAVEEAHVLRDRTTGHSRGFAFVTLESAVLRDVLMIEYELHGRKLTVNKATAKKIKESEGK